MFNATLCLSAGLAALSAMQKREPDLELATFWGRPPEDWAPGWPTYQPKPSIALSIGLLEEATKQGIKMRVWTCNNPIQFLSLWDAGLTGAITDNPALFLKGK